VWGGYPGQSGGDAIADILIGKSAPAGRLPITQYPAAYTSQIPMTDMNLRPSASSPGRTYSWFQGQPVYPFGFGLHYTTFSLSWARAPNKASTLESIMNDAKRGHSAPLDSQPFENLFVNVKNTGKVMSDFVTTVYLVKNGGPPPFPNSQLVSYARTSSILPGETRQVQLPVSIGSVARIDNHGNMVLYPGRYEYVVDVPTSLKASFTITGQQSDVLKWPQRPSNSSSS
jgi:beta-D-xylosidase 4